MAAHPVRRVFAAYARKDARSVLELVRLIRMTGAPVFLDVDSIPTGESWRETIHAAILNANLVAVFWTESASQSQEVQHEWQLALELKKPIVPVVMDGPALPPELAAYQGVDLSDMIAPHDVTFDSAPYIHALLERFALASRPEADA